MIKTVERVILKQNLSGKKDKPDKENFELQTEIPDDFEEIFKEELKHENSNN